ncbi:hypothetical protein HYFRA_00005995 [Hymenoscyphus fraxineus]|uniref:Uncharacterized protein n=1 Tax=Hymenoscyphus fraxineus TaxID=746836 RepID=A0A9N9KU89_9HELO|nr:hypothetical protein HYFRA_00005995 [Hymenoscyphus fraxineus]
MPQTSDDQQSALARSRCTLHKPQLTLDEFIAAEFSSSSSPEPLDDPQPPDTKPFPFLALPPEIRDAIYKDLLKIVPTWKPSSRNIWLDHFGSLKRFRRRVYTDHRAGENGWQMPRAPHGLIQAMIMDFGFLWDKQYLNEHFKGAVMEYTLKSIEALPDESNLLSCILPLAQVQVLCERIREVAYSLPRFHHLYNHKITLLDPYEDKNEESINGSLAPNSFYSVKLQNKLLRGFSSAFDELLPNFEVQGTVSETLRLATISTVTIARNHDPTKFLRRLAIMNKQRKELQKERDWKGAAHECSMLEQRIGAVHQTYIGEETARVGGIEFRNAVAEMEFLTLYHKVKSLFRHVKELYTRDGTIFLWLRPAYTLQETILAADVFLRKLRNPEAGWQTSWHPNLDKLARFFRREATAMRLLGRYAHHLTYMDGYEDACLHFAETSIMQAEALAPDDLAVRAESSLITVWRVEFDANEGFRRMQAHLAYSAGV